VIPLIRDLQSAHASATVLFTGHSLGAAIATCGAADFVFNEKLEASLFTVGSPRVIDVRFAELLTPRLRESVRMVHEKDIVPPQPPRLPLFYHHVGREVWQRTSEEEGGNDTYQVCDGSGEDPSCSNSVCSAVFGCSSVDDHLSYLGLPMRSGCDQGNGDEEGADDEDGLPQSWLVADAISFPLPDILG